MKKAQFLKPALTGLALLLSTNAFAERTLLNVSYDPTRELYKEFNQIFIKHWKDKTGEEVAIQQSHGGWASVQAKHFNDDGIIIRACICETSKNERK